MFNASRLFLFATALAVAAPLAAQQAPSTSLSGTPAPVAITAPAPANTTAPVAGPVMQPASVGFRVQSTSASQPMMAMPVNGDNSQNMALMLVGGAGLIVGAVIGGRTGTIVMLGSGVLGLVGLFRYLQ